MAPVTRPPLRRGRFWLGLGSGLSLLGVAEVVVTRRVETGL